MVPPATLIPTDLAISAFYATGLRPVKPLELSEEDRRKVARPVIGDRCLSTVAMPKLPMRSSLTKTPGTDKKSHFFSEMAMVRFF